MKTVFHVGSMPAEQVSKLKLDGLVLADCANHHVVHALGMCPDPGIPFARTTGEGNYSLFATEETDVPARYAVHASEAVVTVDSHTDEVLAAMCGLGVKKLGIYIGRPDGGNMLDTMSVIERIMGWMVSHGHPFKHLYIISNAWEMTFTDMPHFHRNVDAFQTVLRWAGWEFGGNEAEGMNYYYEVTSPTTAKIVGVRPRETEDAVLPVELKIPETVRNGFETYRVTEIDDAAFGLDRRPNDDWRDHVRTICLPRYVIQASPARIARHFDNLDEVVTDTENRHLRTRTWYRADLEEPEEGARIMTAKEFFGEED